MKQDEIPIYAVLDKMTINVPYAEMKRQFVVMRPPSHQQPHSAASPFSAVALASASSAVFFASASSASFSLSPRGQSSLSRGIAR